MAEKPLVVVTRKIPDLGLKLLVEHFTVKVNSKAQNLTAAQLAKFVGGASAILAMLTDKINQEIFAAAGPKLKIVANYAVGFENIDLIAAKKRRVMITNTPEVLTEAVAEQALALFLAVSRRIPESHQFVMSGKFKGWEPELLLGEELYGKTLGILGLGRIGSRVAEIGAMGFKMKVIYYDRGRRNRELDQKIGAQAVTIRKLLTSSDVISLHVPLTKETRHLVSRSELSSMKKTTILINTSRGPVVDEKALAWALENQVIWGAGIDVFEFEPNVTPSLKKLKNLVMTPHAASATYEAREAMAELAAKNIIAVLKGQLPLTPVK